MGVYLSCQISLEDVSFRGDTEAPTFGERRWHDDPWNRLSLKRGQRHSGAPCKLSSQSTKLAHKPSTRRRYGRLHRELLQHGPAPQRPELPEPNRIRRSTLNPHPTGRIVISAVHRMGSSPICSPNGIRTRVATLRGWCPRPLDDGAGRWSPRHRGGRRCSGGRTRTLNNWTRTSRVADYTTPEWVGV